MCLEESNLHILSRCLVWRASILLDTNIHLLLHILQQLVALPEHRSVSGKDFHDASPAKSPLHNLAPRPEQSSLSEHARICARHRLKKPFENTQIWFQSESTGAFSLFSESDTLLSCLAAWQAGCREAPGGTTEGKKTHTHTHMHTTHTCTHFQVSNSCRWL